MLRRVAITLLILPFTPMVSKLDGQTAKILIAHRGASGYAPEHTLAAYRLALEQKVDFVEPDLAVTKDGVLVCLHDASLERTTDVATVFPDRSTPNTSGRGSAKQWLANDFTLAEMKRLDAGRWFDAKFAGQRMPTFQEMIELVRGKAGLYPELKSPPLYVSRGVDMEQIFVRVIKLPRRR
jgi:glycerophosphoryl diester phosphodiesterase